MECYTINMATNTHWEATSVECMHAHVMHCCFVNRPSFRNLLSASQLVLTLYVQWYSTQCDNKVYKPLLTISWQPPQHSNECYDQNDNDEDTNHNFEGLPPVICIGKHGSYNIGSNLWTFSCHKNGIHQVNVSIHLLNLQTLSWASFESIPSFLTSFFTRHL